MTKFPHTKVISFPAIFQEESRARDNEIIIARAMMRILLLMAASVLLCWSRYRQLAYTLYAIVPRGLSRPPAALLYSHFRWLHWPTVSCIFPMSLPLS